MSAVFSSAGFRELRGAWALLVVAIAAAIGLGVGGKLYLEHDKRQRATSGAEAAGGAGAPGGGAAGAR
jgi:hypothetical protein